MPAQAQEKIKIHVEHLLSNYPEIELIYLRGSWASGQWITDETDEDYKQLKLEVQGKNTNSDFDYICLPYQERFSEIKEIDLQSGPNSGIIVYQKEKNDL